MKLVGGGSVMNGAIPSSLFKTNLSTTSVSQEVGSCRHLEKPGALCLFRLVDWISRVIQMEDHIDPYKAEIVIS